MQKYRVDVAMKIHDDDVARTKMSDDDGDDDLIDVNALKTCLVAALSLVVLKMKLSKGYSAYESSSDLLQLLDYRLR